MIAALLSLSLAAAPLAQESEYEPPPWEEVDEGGGRKRILLSGWVGEALDDGGAGSSSSTFGGEIAWAFEALDVGLSAHGYRRLARSTREWTPVLLLRLTQRFRTGRGVEAAFGFGLGAGRTDGWDAWYQAALGVRIPLGPLFLGGEIAFEQFDLLRLEAGLGVAF